MMESWETGLFVLMSPGILIGSTDGGGGGWREIGRRGLKTGATPEMMGENEGMGGCGTTAGGGGGWGTREEAEQISAKAPPNPPPIGGRRVARQGWGMGPGGICP